MRQQIFCLDFNDDGDDRYILVINCNPNSNNNYNIRNNTYSNDTQMQFMP